MDGLHDEPRSGTPRTIEDARIEAVIVKTLESAPKNATHWSSRGMAREIKLSTSTVQRIWRAFGLQPHRLETFKLSTDPEFVAKVRDVVGLYVSPPERAIAQDRGQCCNSRTVPQPRSKTDKRAREHSCNRRSI